MMTYTRYSFALLLAFITVFAVFAQDEEDNLSVVPYFQSYAFNVPILEGWENQSTEDTAQFYLADAEATIRTNIVGTDDAVDGAELDISTFFDNADLPDPVYNEKVNLADGTWAVLVYQIDDITTASAMARVDGGQTYVIGFIESNPDADIYMVTIAHGENAQEDPDPTPEIAIAVETFTDADPTDLSNPETLNLPSGEWTRQTTDDVTAMGWVFGNDSYLAIANGDIDNLPDLANAYNTTLLGFFVTPDNSGYLALGLVASIGTLLILLFSIWWRSRSLQKDLAVIQQLAEDDD